MKGEVPQPGGFEVARADIRIGRLESAEQHLSTREAFYKTFFGQETSSSPEELPASFFLPAPALGDISRAIQRSYTTGREHSQFIKWHPEKGFRASPVYKGGSESTSLWEDRRLMLHEKIDKKVLTPLGISSRMVAVKHHTHPWGILPYSYEHGLFSQGDIRFALERSIPLNLVATHDGILGLLKTERAMGLGSDPDHVLATLQDKIKEGEETPERLAQIQAVSGLYFFPNELYYQHDLDSMVSELQDIGFGLYHWKLPMEHLRPPSPSEDYEDCIDTREAFRENWMRFFATNEAREMRTHGITMTKLVTQPLEESSPAPETRVFGQL